jgi:chromosome segregation ATPase
MFKLMKNFFSSEELQDTLASNARLLTDLREVRTNLILHKEANAELRSRVDDIDTARMAATEEIARLTAELENVKAELSRVCMDRDRLTVESLLIYKRANELASELAEGVDEGAVELLATQHERDVSLADLAAVRAKLLHASKQRRPNWNKVVAEILR